MPAESPFELLESPIPDWELGEISAVLAREFGLTGGLAPLPGERDQNLLLDASDGRFMVKIANSSESIEVLEMHQAALAHINRQHMEIEVPRPRPALDGRLVVSAGRGGDLHPIRVQTFIEGQVLRDLPAGSVTAYEIGVAVARLQMSLRGFFHPAAGGRILWDMRQATELVAVAGAVQDPDLRSRVVDMLAHFDEAVAPSLDRLPAQVIHNDMNPDNLLVTDGSISGVIDFGDMVHGPRLMDLAVAAAYQLQSDLDPQTVLSEICAGYESVSELLDDEVALLGDLTEVRLCQSITIGAWHAQRHPENAEYILGDAEGSRAALLALDGVEWPRPAAEPGRLLSRRVRSIAPGLRLSFDSPLYLVSGDGVWVQDAEGRRYLDGYNNVVQVGHGSSAHRESCGASDRSTEHQHAVSHQ